MSNLQQIKNFLIEEEVSAFGDGDLVAKMATRDMALLLDYMYKNSDKIVSNKEEALHVQFARALKEQEEILDKKMNPNKKKPSDQKDEKKNTDKKETSN